MNTNFEGLNVFSGCLFSERLCIIEIEWCYDGELFLINLLKFYFIKSRKLQIMLLVVAYL